jgi:hypothetical protein
MQRLVITFWIGDGCTYSSEITVPLEYESPEAFLVNFADWAAECINQAKVNKTYIQGRFTVGSYEFDVTDHVFRNGSGNWSIDLPEVYTLEEWFNESKVTKMSETGK